MKEIILEILLELAAFLQRRYLDDDHIERYYNAIKQVLKKRIAGSDSILLKICSPLLLLKPILLPIIKSVVKLASERLSTVSISQIPVSSEFRSVLANSTQNC